MRTETESQEIKIEDREKYMAEKETLLSRYKALAEDLEYAMDDFEKGSIMAKRETLASKIKTLSNTLREIEAIGTQA